MEHKQNIFSQYLTMVLSYLWQVSLQLFTPVIFDENEQANQLEIFRRGIIIHSENSLLIHLFTSEGENLIENRSKSYV